MSDTQSVIGKLPPTRRFGRDLTPEQIEEGCEALRLGQSIIWNCIIDRGVTVEWDEKEQRIRIGVETDNGRE